MLWLYVSMVLISIRGLFNNGIINLNFVASNNKWLLTNKLESVLNEVVLS